mmetsp:Transcript_257/g.508  ORF Transcript_257/g.508 Transcript_257/m.508 type:complete len:329 (+) Transcript_257:153-1139(+)
MYMVQSISGTVRNFANNHHVRVARSSSCTGKRSLFKFIGSAFPVKSELIAQTERCSDTASADTSTAENLSSETLARDTSAQSVPASETSAAGQEILSSTWEHRAWVWSTTLLLSATFVKGFSDVDDVETAVLACGSLAASYVLADLGTGIYHWAVDNYGSGRTPVFGKQIEAFQGHHVRPWTITEREFCNNVHQVFKPALAPSAALALLAGTATPEWNIGASSFLYLACMSQQFHAWSHMKKSELPAAVLALQDAGVLISRKAHGAHHRAPFEGNYCIVSGVWNPILDRGFFRWLERRVADATGAEPRCWHEPQRGWAPEAQPGEEHA